MRLLVIFCHPVPDSFGGALRDLVVDSAKSAGHDVRLKDLYAEGFNPVMSAEERLGYHDAGTNEIPVAKELEALRWAEGVIFVHPTWWYAQPAMLKGWLDRVLVPHVAFTMPTQDKAIGPGLTHIRLVAQITTLGSPWWLWTLMGRPGRDILMRGVASCCGPRCKTVFMGLHKMDTASASDREKFLSRVGKRIKRIPL
ncbi:MAG: putative NADPH-quinone reductase [Paracoccaceae bacterium]|jgi:NAD(P)H dehydrogenase (quinone)